MTARKNKFWQIDKLKLIKYKNHNICNTTTVWRVSVSTEKINDKIKWTEEIVQVQIEICQMALSFL